MAFKKPVEKDFNVYYRKEDNSLGNFNVLHSSHDGAILEVQNELDILGEKHKKPMLAVINGGNNEQRTLPGRDPSVA